MDVLKKATARNGERDMRLENDGPSTEVATLKKKKRRVGDA